MELKHLINDDLLILFITLQGTEPICRKTGSKHDLVVMEVW